MVWPKRVAKIATRSVAAWLPNTSVAKKATPNVWLFICTLVWPYETPHMWPREGYSCVAY
jgi:hypothetical protein